MKRIIMFVLLFAALKVAGQTTGYLRFDTVRIMKQNGTCELYVINKTKDSLGLLTNVGGGLTQFRRSKMLNDSTIIIGLDTITIKIPLSGEKILGTIYQNTNFTSLSGFIVNSATVSPTGGHLAFTGGNPFTQTLDLDSARSIEQWIMGSKIKIVSTGSGAGLGMRSTNTTLAYSIQGKFNSSDGKIYLYSGPNTQVAVSSSTLSFSTGDTVELIVELDRTILRAKARNLTTNSTAISVEYNFLFSSTRLPNTGRFCVYSNGGSFDVDSLSIWSKVPRNPALILFADSKHRGYTVTGEGYRVGDLLNNYGRSCVILAGSGDKTLEFLSRYKEVLQIAGPQTKVILGGCSNDPRNGVDSATYCHQYDSFANLLVTAGLDLYHITGYWEPGVDQNPFRNHLYQTYPANKIIETLTPTQQPGLLDADNIHMNDVGNQLAFDVIVRSGKLPGLNVSYDAGNTVIRNQNRSYQPAHLKILGNGTFGSLVSGATPPTITGASKVVVADANGQLSLKDSSAIGGNAYIKNTTSAQTTSSYFVTGTSAIAPSGTYRSLLGFDLPATLYINIPQNNWGLSMQKALSGTSGPYISLWHTTNSDINIRTPSASGDFLGEYNWQGNDKDSTIKRMAGLTSFVRVGSLHTGGGIIFNTTDTTTGIYSDKMHLTSEGNLRLGGTSTVLYRLHIQSGDVYFANNSFTIGNIGIGTTSPTARLHLPAGTATASTAPLKFTAGTNLTTPEAGAMEFDGSHFYGTIGSTRYQLDQQSGLTSINSQTGPAITLSGGVATYVTNPSGNTLAYNVDPTSDIFTRSIDAIITTAQNSGTSETDLFSKSIAGSTLNTDKQTLNFEADGEFNDNTATAQIKLYFGGNVTLNTGAVNISTASTAWRLKGYIIRTSSTTAHVTYELQCPGLATPLFIGYSNLTSLDFTTSNIFKITAQAGGGGGGTGDITAHSWQLLYRPQP